MSIYIYVNQIKTANNAVGELVFFVCVCKSSDAVEWSCFCFFNSLNKMTNAACENAMRRCPRN